MKNVFRTVTLIILLLAHCTGKGSRIDLLEEATGLSLPEEYQELKHETAEAGAFGSDFTLRMELKLDEQGMQQIIRQIETASATPQTAKLGRWEKTGEGYRLVKDDQNEITEATVNVSERIIRFRFTHL